MNAPLAVLVNGAKIGREEPALHVLDRGLNYGDGLFETARVRNGTLRFVEAHLARLRQGCERLQMSCPEREILTDIATIVGDTNEAILKIVLTRGQSGRGYRPAADSTPNRILSLHDAPLPTDIPALRLRWCAMRLSRNERLAGIKHLNRLEQVLAQGEWAPSEADEGLMMDTAGEVVCATAANVFLVRQDILTTPDLRFCGVHGVMRAQVLEAAKAAGLTISIEPVWPDDFAEASEVFITNAVWGIRSVGSLDELQWSNTRVATQLSSRLGL
jgi:4-amino-4-deoxychorismate lyase